MVLATELPVFVLWDRLVTNQQTPITQALIPAARCWSGIVSALAVLFLMVACDRSHETVQEARQNGRQATLTATSVTPTATVDQCIAAYDRLSSYEDEGYVRLLYTLDGQDMEDRAPLSIAWDRQGNLGIHVYSVKAGPTEMRWRLRINDNSVDTQIISRSVPAELDLAWLLDDRLVAASLSAGLAGFPPQLDLLLSDSPLSGLLDAATSLAFMQGQSVDGRACHVIAVNHASDEYVLWIDQATMLLRRLHLPASRLPPEMLTDQRISNVQLTIELANIRTDSQVDWKRFAPPIHPQDVMVQHFVPKLQEVDTRLLNRRVPAFELQSLIGEDSIHSASLNAEGKTLVMVWLADHPACRAVCEQLADLTEWLQANDPEVAQRTQFVGVWAEPNPPAGTSFSELRRAWRIPGKLAIDRGAMGRDLLQIAEAPTLVVLDSENRVHFIDARVNPNLNNALLPVLSKLAAGENVAAAILASYENANTRWSAELSMARAMDAPANSGKLAVSYPPAFVQLTHLGVVRSNTEFLATAVDSDQFLWQLAADGQLAQASITGEIQATYETPWSENLDPEGHVDSGAKLRIQVSDESRFVACGERDGHRIQMFDTKTRQNRVVLLDETSHIVDFSWVDVAGSSFPRLALVTADSQTLLLDPMDREQMRGRCNAAPQAIVSVGSDRAPIDASVVLANGRIEPLALSGETIMAQSPGKPVGLDISKGTIASQSKQLDFIPALGPWQKWLDKEQQFILARGWLAKDEPAVFLVDAALKPQWHFRMPVRAPSDCWQLVSVATDPISGQPTWILADAGSRTIHFFRNDGRASDHMQVSQPVMGLALAPAGASLRMRLVHPREFVDYEVHW